MGMGKRPFRCYSKIKTKPYVKSRYTKKIPQNKLKFYNIGNQKLKNRHFPIRIDIINDYPINISSECLESVRVTINRYLSKKINKSNFHIRFNSHPWQILRINKMLSCAGADRIQTGMRKAFGKPYSICSRVIEKFPILSIKCLILHIKIIKKALSSAIYKINGKQFLRIAKRWGFSKINFINYVERFIDVLN